MYLILTLNQKYGVTLLISSHLLDEISKMVTKYGIINNGVLIEEVDAEELKARCTQRLLITTSDLAKSAELIQTALPDVIMEVTDSNIILRNHVADAAADRQRQLPVQKRPVIRQRTAVIIPRSAVFRLYASR